MDWRGPGVSGFIKQLISFLPRSRNDPRAALEAGEPYAIDAEWTPTEAAIAEARRRHEAYRANPEIQWHRIKDAHELERVRISVIGATADSKVLERTGEALRILRVLAFDPEAEFFERALQVLPDRRLVEFRHPRLRMANRSAPLGFRFICFSSESWHRRDFVGLYLDGSRGPIDDAFKELFNKDGYEPSLIEHYVSFAFDHQQFKTDQLYVVRDLHDFAAADAVAGEPDPFLKAQFQLSVPPPEKAEGADLFTAALPESLLIPPTMFGFKHDVATVFATIVLEQKLYHVGMTVAPDGKITVGDRRQRTPPGRAIPVIPVRSFAEQRAALKNAFDEQSRPNAKAT